MLELLILMFCLLDVIKCFVTKSFKTADFWPRVNDKIKVFRFDPNIHEIGGGLRGLRDPPKTQKSQKATPPETPLKSSGIATTLKPNSNPPKNFRDRPPMPNSTPSPLLIY